MGDGGDADPELLIKSTAEGDEGSATEDEDGIPGAKPKQSKESPPKPKKVRTLHSPRCYARPVTGRSYSQPKKLKPSAHLACHLVESSHPLSLS